jgi:hypothetical protein
MFQTPVAFFVFNRPDTTAQVFEAIRHIQPAQLLLVADGARSHKAGEAEKCAAVRKIISQIDWKCDVLENFSDTNLGCKQRVVSGLNWVFEQVEAAIVLEDDCLPNPSFFRFCQAMLKRFSEDERIMMICGTNLLEEWKSKQQSYHLSHHTTIWGWATWRRAWQYYDVNMTDWPNGDVQNRVKDLLGHEKLYLNRKQAFEAVYQGKIDTWDLQWAFTRLLQSGLSVIPSVNLVSNIGFTEDATHTKTGDDPRAKLATYDMAFPLKPPVGAIADQDYLRLCYEKFEDSSLKARVLRKIKRMQPIVK